MKTALLLFLLMPRIAWSHEPGEGPPIDGTLAALSIILLAVLYGRGVVRMGRIRRDRVAYLALACAALLLALTWPLDALAARSFAAHMAQHMVLLIIAPLLLIAAHPLAPILRALPRSIRVASAGWVSFLSRRNQVGRLAAATVVQAAILSFWHVPLFYDAALASTTIHVAEHVTILASALWFWWEVTRAARHEIRIGFGMAMIFLTFIHSGMLGGLLTFARRPLYDSYALQPDNTLDYILADQQLAGLIMWVPACFVYIAAALWLLAALLREEPVRGPSPEPSPDF